jgi:hypothetical protein
MLMIVWSATPENSRRGGVGQVRERGGKSSVLSADPSFLTAMK